MEGIDRRLRALKRIARAPTTRSVVVNRVFSSNENLPRLLVKRHTPQSTTGIFQNTRRLALSPSGDHECQYSARRRDIKHSNGPVLCFKTGDGLLRFEDNALARTTIVNQIAADNRHRPVRETDCYLREIVDDRKGRYLQHPLALSLPLIIILTASAPGIASWHSAPTQSTNTSARHLSSPYREPRL